MHRQLKPGEIDTTEMSSLEWQSNYKATKLIKTGICIFPIQHARLNFLRSQTRSVTSKSLAFAVGEMDILWGVRLCFTPQKLHAEVEMVENKIHKITVSLSLPSFSRKYIIVYCSFHT